MRLDGCAQVSNPRTGETIRYENAGLAVWTGHSAKKAPWFDYRRGRVVVKNPDPEILRKMWALAQRLSAQVEGDGGETYDSNGNAVLRR